jgi:plastocyanin
MRSRLLLVAGLAVLALPASASANADVQVMDDFFQAKTVQIQPHESVTWHWGTGTTHTVTSFANQTIKFNSHPKHSGQFTETFDKPGRFRYFCQIHGPSMSGVVEVGPAPFPDTLLPVLKSVKATPGEGTVKLGFKLSEKSKVKVSLSGPSDKSSTKKLAKGERSVTFKKLKAGKYKATLRPTDGAGNRGKAAVKRFTID